MNFLLKNTQQVLLSAEDIVKQFRDVVNKAFHKNGLSISYDQWQVLSELSTNQGISQNDLAANTKKEPASISRILKLLIEKDLVLKVEDKLNKRTNRIYTSEKGKQIVAKGDYLFEALAKKGFQGVYDQEINMFVTILGKIETNLGKKINKE